MDHEANIYIYLPLKSTKQQQAPKTACVINPKHHIIS